ncbi:helix-turn-helix transcriptional regulator [Xanthomarina sp. F1114]|uniref:helix-turn-helix domain-containing protein n=1 Tax=Xanthomarina sp. F1114 TaxID=2996019 RepID=UPI00225DF44E|nr:helix-turn-helix transcriptional regulator [Xanthomarina sp. F1114]MCX7546832.1 helix-turn-helix transcriptional regulator [Xanthomarina sp. F1114]
MASFGNFIKEEREKREWTQIEFGDRIGINSSAISRIENGNQKFSITKLKKLAAVLKIDFETINDLFFADKFAKEAFKYKCTENVFSVAENTSKYIRNKNTKQGSLEF